MHPPLAPRHSSLRQKVYHRRMHPFHQMVERRYIPEICRGFSSAYRVALAATDVRIGDLTSVSIWMGCGSMRSVLRA